MPKDKAGELFVHILEYVNDMSPETNDLLIELAFEPIKQQLKRDLDKWTDIKKIRSEAGKTSANKKKQKSTNSTSVNTSQQKSTSVNKRQQTSTNSTVNDNVTVNVNDNVINNKNKTAGRCLFRNSIYFDKAKFKEALPDWNKAKLLHYYESALNWSDSNGKGKIDWIATVKIWARKDEKEGKTFDVKQVNHNLQGTL